jgi:hypothetical protein
MNTNDLPPAAKLAALIEAGVAANPDIAHSDRITAPLYGNQACALGYACLGAGADRDELRERSYIVVETLLGLPVTFAKSADLSWRVMTLNDGGASIPEICASLREGELAKVAA